MRANFTLNTDTKDLKILLPESAFMAKFPGEAAPARLARKERLSLLGKRNLKISGTFSHRVDAGFYLTGV